MKRVSIVGFGMGAGTLTADGLLAAREADALIGAPRLLRAFESFGKVSFAQHSPEAVARIVCENNLDRFCVLVSGDVGFYSAAQGIHAALAGFDTVVIPGISSLSYFLARLNRPWQDVRALSCHGRRANFADAVRRSRLTFALTGGNIPALCAQLCDTGFGGLTAFAGENLGTPEERILTLPVSDLPCAGIAGLAVLLVENPNFDARTRFGIPDAVFTRGGVPMTKSEVRAVVMSRLALHPGAVCCDIGAGTGSVTVEMALAAHEGHVYAVDKSEESIRLVRANCRGFHVGNVTPLLGGAPEALRDLPPLDAVFIGGSTGRLGDIFSILLGKNPRTHIVLAAVTLETVQAAREAFAAYGVEPEIVQLGAARVKAAGNTHMLEALSPIFIFSGGGR